MEGVDGVRGGRVGHHPVNVAAPDVLDLVALDAEHGHVGEVGRGVAGAQVGHVHVAARAVDAVPVEVEDRDELFTIMYIIELFISFKYKRVTFWSNIFYDNNIIIFLMYQLYSNFG